VGFSHFDEKRGVGKGAEVLQCLLGMPVLGDDKLFENSQALGLDVIFSSRLCEPYKPGDKELEVWCQAGAEFRADELENGKAFARKFYVGGEGGQGVENRAKGIESGHFIPCQGNQEAVRVQEFLELWDEGSSGEERVKVSQKAGQPLFFLPQEVGKKGILANYL